MASTRSSFAVCLILAAIDFILADEIPKFIKEPESVIVKARGKVVLRCTVDLPAARIRWKYNGDFIETNEDEGVIINGGTLHIKSFKHSKRHKPHAGKYQCVANTSIGAVASLVAEVQKADIDRFDRNLPDIIVNATKGNVALVPCVPPESSPSPILTFEVNSTVIDNEYSVRHKILPSGALQIEDARPIDQGTYICRAENPITGKLRGAFQKVTLRILNPVINAPPRVIQAPPKKSAARIGSNLTLECVMNGAPVPVVNWIKYGDVLPEGRYEQMMGNLLLVDIRLEDAGTYICQAENGQGMQATGVAVVEVLEMPTIDTPPSDQTVTEGDTVVFNCLATGKPKVKTSWLYNGQPVFRDSAVSITELGPSNETTLTLHQVSLNQAGFYQCMAQSRIGMATAAAWLRVKKRKTPLPPAIKAESDKDGATVKPQAIAPDHEPNHSAVTRPSINIGPSNTTVSEGQTVTLLCLTEDADVVSWLKDGTPIDYALNERHEVSSADSLQIDNVQLTDSGEYMCLASNQLGFSTANAFVEVTDSLVNIGIPDLMPGPVFPPLNPKEDKSNPTSSPTGNATSDPVQQNTTDGSTTTTTTSKMIERVILTNNSAAKPQLPKKPSVFDTDLTHFDYNENTDDIILLTTRAPPGGVTMPPFGSDGRRGKNKNKKKDRDRDRERDRERERERELERERERERGRNRDRKKKKNRSGEVLVPPSKPKVTKLSDNSVMLKWSVSDNEGLRIRFFRVQYRELSNSKKRGSWETIEDDISAVTRQYEVAGLKPGATYKFRIAAVYSNNDNKLGPSSGRFKLSVEPTRRQHPPVAGPVIVEAKSMSPSDVAIRWKYLPLGTIAVEGFFIFYKPYGSQEEFKRQEVFGGNLVNYVLNRLRPDTEYEIKMQCFNSAGESDFSNTVVKRTLASSGSSGAFPGETDYYPGVPVDENPFMKKPNRKNVPYDANTFDVINTYDKDGQEKPELTPTQTQEEDQFERKMNTQSSSMLLYMVLGIVLGVMMLLLVIFMVMCGLKQRQQRRMMAELDASMRHKFHDPAQRIHNDNIRKKYMNGGFALNGISHQNGGGIYANANGSIRNGYLPNQQGSKVNISVNPMTQLDHQHYPEQNGTIKSNGELAHNLQEILMNGDVIYNSLERQSHGPPSFHESQDPHYQELMNSDPLLVPRQQDGSDTEDVHNGVQAPEFQYTTGQNHHTRQSTFKPEPPDPSRIPNRSHEQLNPNYDPYDSCHNMGTQYGGSYSRSHDQIPKSPYDYTPRSQQDFTNHSLNHSLNHSMTHQMAHSPHDHQGGVYSNNLSEPSPKVRQKRRRRSRDKSNMKDQSTNTDYSSNDGTLDNHSLTYRSLDTLRREEAYHRRSPVICPDIPQVHDYSDYNFD
ncbi:brother of CDO-like isoform X3 [Lineus longissimus]|uniref:brother of CDO-like isoform X3 n=1 Tax=Lineus longissimus TaxID=88925 RepID=UPI00315CEC3A